MKIGVPKEIHPGEKRVAMTPEVAEKLKKLGFSIAIEIGAGRAADILDEDYSAVGCELVASPETLWRDADIIMKVRAPEKHFESGRDEVELMKQGQVLISFIWPGQNPALMQRLQKMKVTVLAMDSIPRLSRAQKMDALSSMANIAGYRAVIEAAHHFGRFFTGQITAAGKIPPAKILVIGAGVAGLSAIGTAGALGAIVRGFDTRREVKDQVESMGGEFLELIFPNDGTEEGSGQGGYAKVMSDEFIRVEMELFAKQAKEVDIIITTALIPGKPAPKLITTEMVRSMKPGSVIVDLAAEQGGNCDLTEAGKVVVKHGVTLIGYTDLPSRLAKQSSQLYSNNLLRLIEDLCPSKDGMLSVNMEDDVIRGATIVKDGVITWPAPPLKISSPPAASVKAAPVKSTHSVVKDSQSSFGSFVAIACAGIALVVIGALAPPSLMTQLTVFVLACFSGYMIVWNVKASLHTPLMSVTNAISGIIAVGAVLQISSEDRVVQAVAATAVLFATINIVGGFFVTGRMLKMFKK